MGHKCWTENWHRLFKDWEIFFKSSFDIKTLPSQILQRFEPFIEECIKELLRRGWILCFAATYLKRFSPEVLHTSYYTQIKYLKVD